MTSKTNVPNSISLEGHDRGELSAALDNCVSLLTEAVSFAATLEMERNNLDSNEYAVMELFSQQSEWTATQLVEELSLDPSHISRLVAHLVDRRLLRRRRSRTDRRVVHLALTDSGSDMIGEARDKVRAYRHRLLEGVGREEFDGFFTTAHKVFQKYTEIRTTPHG